LLLLLLLLRGCDDDDGSANGPGATTAEQTTDGSGNGAGSADGGAGTLLAGDQDLLAALAGGAGGLEAFEGKDAKGDGVTVQELVNETGFWVGTSDTDRVFVEIEDEGGSPIDAKKGDRVSFTGVIEKNLEAETYGLRANQGAQQFRDQGFHVQVQAGDLEQR
jgi:hypothetical protein